MLLSSVKTPKLLITCLNWTYFDVLWENEVQKRVSVLKKSEIKIYFQYKFSFDSRIMWILWDFILKVSIYYDHLFIECFGLSVLSGVIYECFVLNYCLNGLHDYLDKCIGRFFKQCLMLIFWKVRMSRNIIIKQLQYV